MSGSMWFQDMLLSKRRIAITYSGYDSALAPILTTANNVQSFTPLMSENSQRVIPANENHSIK